MACVGSEASCVPPAKGETRKAGANDNFIQAGVFLGFDATTPARNFAMVMTTEVSIDKIFGAKHA